jgi:hypothetical protein
LCAGDFMSIVGFNFTKISAERKNAVVGTVNINNTITLREVTETKLGLGGDRGAIRIAFAFGSEYTPELATLQMEGDVLLLLEAKQAQAVVDGWKKSKQLPREVAEPVMNHILDRCNIQALLLSKDLNLPSPVQLPKVQFTPPGQAPAGDAKAVKTTKIEKKKK